MLNIYNRMRSNSVDPWSLPYIGILHMAWWTSTSIGMQLCGKYSMGDVQPAVIHLFNYNVPFISQKQFFSNYFCLIKKCLFYFPPRHVAQKEHNTQAIIWAKVFHFESLKTVLCFFNKCGFWCAFTNFTDCSHEVHSQSCYSFCRYIEICAFRYSRMEM